MSCRLGLVAAAVLLVSSPAMAQKKTLIVSIDGCRPDAFLLAKAPNVNTLIDAGAASFDARNTLLYGESGPNYSSMLTGTWLKHGVTSNDYNASNAGNEFPGNHFDEWPHMFSYLEAADPSLYTAQFVGWGPINKGTWADHYANEVGALGDSGNAARIATLLTNGDPDVIFWQISAVDSAGHSGSGFSPTNPAYVNAITTADTYYGTVLTALRNRPGYIDGSEEWLILTVTDHGGYGTSHHLPAPGHELEIQRTFYIATGSGVVPGANLGQPRVYDVAVTTMAHMGLETAGLNLDGKVVPAEPTTRWRLDQSGDVSTTTNWTAGVPNGGGYTANFGAPISAQRTVTIDVPVTYGTMNFGSPHNYTLAGAQVLELKAAGTGIATVAVTQSGPGGGHVVSAPIMLASPLDLNVAPGAAITLSGGISNPSGMAITKTGDGSATLAGPQSHGQAATLTVSGGTLKLSDTTTFASPITNSALVEFEVTAGITWTFSGALDSTGTLTKSGDGTLIVSGTQNYSPGALFDVVNGTLVLMTDAGTQGADLRLRVSDATVLFACDQHLDTLILGDGAKAVFAGARVVVLNHLVFGDVDLGAAVLTPEPTALALLASCALGFSARRRR